MINPVTGWFEKAQYDDQKAIYIEKLFGTMCLSRYPRPIEIIIYQSRVHKTPK